MRFVRVRGLDHVRLASADLNDRAEATPKMSLKASPPPSAAFPGSNRVVGAAVSGSRGVCSSESLERLSAAAGIEGIGDRSRHLVRRHG